MARLGEFLDRQGRLMVENDRLAWCYIAALALIPFSAWLSAAIIALITLRKGWLEGFKGFAVATITLLILSLPSMPWVAAVMTALTAFFTLLLDGSSFALDNKFENSRFIYCPASFSHDCFNPWVST
eukprot:TRINITY_DN54299_c0_g1_i1.p1 TRINITY_DN54299_c0_g1~~TRINITY_DN54299_c0_g1_i1.p1  ORF type:complete len:127 (-),score=1.98 TRINITY_DN54299_c0_g1_i1:11-391(-)